MAIDKAARTSFRQAVVAHEAPRTLVVAGGAFGLITVLNSLVGPPMAPGVLIVNLVAAALLIAGAVAVSRSIVPVAGSSWILAIGALVLVLIGQVQLWLRPDVVGFYYVLLIIVVFPLLTMAWAPVLTVTVPMLAGCVIVAFGQLGDEAADWVIASVATVSVALALLWLRVRTVDELADASVLIGELATRDRLTGALNRHGIEERIPELVGLAAREGEPVFAVFADVDGLKGVNDVHGHAFGDTAILATADAIRETVRAADLVGRWGGDEFIVLGIGHLEHADDLGDRIWQCILRQGMNGSQWPGGVSVGMASSEPGELDMEALIRRADADMYERRRARRAPDPADPSI